MRCGACPILAARPLQSLRVFLFVAAGSQFNALECTEVRIFLLLSIGTRCSVFFNNLLCLFLHCSPYFLSFFSFETQHNRPELTKP
jgi:uncharacterized membrane protein